MQSERAPDGTQRRFDVHVHRLVPAWYRDGKITNGNEKQRGKGRGKEGDNILYVQYRAVTHRSSGGEEGKVPSLTSGARNHRTNYRIKAQCTLYTEPAELGTARCSGDDDVGANERARKRDRARGSIARTYGVCGAANRATAKSRNAYARTHARVAIDLLGAPIWRDLFVGDKRLEPRPKDRGLLAGRMYALRRSPRECESREQRQRGRTCRRRRGTLIAVARPIAMNHLLLA